MINHPTYHTPSPWQVVRLYTATPQIAICIEGAAKSTGRIATVPLRDGFQRRNTADACLIAAAPDMLAVLLALEGAANHWSDSEAFLIAKRIKAAIKKATNPGTIAIDI